MSRPFDDVAEGTVDSSEILVPGPWEHRFVAANGARFHVAAAGPRTGPLVVLLHGFPQFWWAWRRQLPALAAAGYLAVAMDLRGYGASDKPPRGYDTTTLAADVAGVVRALGRSEAVIVGHDWGGWLAWSMPSLAPTVTRAVAAVSMAHPLAMRAGLADRRDRSAWARSLAFQVPIRPERQLTRGDTVERMLREASMHPPDPQDVERYRRAVRVPFVAHCSLEYFRWELRSLPRQDGRRFAAAVRRPISVPVLQIHGADDPIVTVRRAAASHRWAGTSLRYELLGDAGHFLPEEAPDEVTKLLLDWLAPH